MDHFFIAVEKDDRLAAIGVDRNGIARSPRVGLQIVDGALFGEIHRLFTAVGGV